MISSIQLIYRDVKGFSSAVRVHVNYDTIDHAATILGTLNTAIAALTNAAFNGSHGLAFNAPKPTVYGSNAVFSTIEDKAAFTFVDNAGVVHRFQIPAPKDAIFLADGETVDPANGLVTAFVTAMTTAGAGPSFFSSTAGNAITFFAAGVRVRRKIRRKINIFTLNPSLSGPDE
jgi:hypothetical protein